MERDAELLLDEVSHTPTRPKVGRVTELAWALLEPAQDGLSLSIGQLRHASQSGLACQPGIAPFFVVGLPFLDGPNMNAEKVGDLLCRMAVLESLNRQVATSLQLSRGSLASQARVKVHSRCKCPRMEDFAA
jgi:hypothetical protein